ncbi:MAG: hypothetical protein H6R11_2421 [Proteobacteria bacterium]|nr:hypothetical protein [Pseudomonadota bacterium]
MLDLGVASKDRFLEIADLLLRGLRGGGDALRHGRIELRCVEVLSRDEADLGELRHHRRILGGRRVGLQQFREQLEVRRGSRGANFMSIAASTFPGDGVYGLP